MMLYYKIKIIRHIAVTKVTFCVNKRVLNKQDMWQIVI
jgi:hypothetical protein